MSVGATMLYGLSNVYTKVRLKNAGAMGTSVGTLLLGAAALAPLAFIVPAPRPIEDHVYCAFATGAYFVTNRAFARF